MVFTSPSYINKLPFDPPDNVPIHDFFFPQDGKAYGRQPMDKSQPPFVCGISGKSHSAAEVRDRIDHLARALSKELGIKSDDGGDELNKVIGVFTLNAVDTLPVSWAAHRLNGVSTPISPSYSTAELSRQLKVTKAKALFTCLPLLPIALEAAADAGIAKEHVYLIELPEKFLQGATGPSDIKTVDQLIDEGKKMDAIPAVEFSDGQGARQTAFLCSSSGTSGLPKNVKISHKSVIANVMQLATHESNHRSKESGMALGVLPLSHSYALIVTGHYGIYQGDGLVVLPKFDLYDVLQAVQDQKVSRLWMVPPMVVAMIKASAVASKYDLSSVTSAVVGATNLTKDVYNQFKSLFPKCILFQGYGLTEAAVVLCFQNPGDPMDGSCGHIYPGVEARLVDEAGKDVTEYDTAGELWVKTPSVMMGYLDNESATKESITDDGWLRTGDLMEVRKSAGGHEHFFITDRVKELIKVRGIQVSPTEVEEYLLKHPAIADVAVMPIPNDAAGELPIAFIVRSPEGKEEEEKVLKSKINAFVDEELADYKRLAGGIEFVDALPKSASGKTQRGTMKQKAKDIYEASKKAAEKPAVIQSFEFDSDDDSD